MKSLAPLALLALALLVPAPAQAQDVQAFAAVAGSPGEIPYEGNGTIPLDLTIGCAHVLQAGPGFTGSVAATGAPSWLTVTETSFEVEPSACANPNGQVATSVTVPVKVAKDAPGVVEQTVTLTATLADATADATARFTVAYHSNYTLVADTTFPANVTGETFTFKVTATQSSNARSMIMIEEMTTTAGAVFSGIASGVYEVEAGKPATKTFDVTFKAPAGKWNASTVSFKTFGHYLLADGAAGDYEPAVPYTYTFVNGAPDTGGDGKKGKESPAPVGAITALGLLGLAAAIRRKA